MVDEPAIPRGNEVLSPFEAAEPAAAAEPRGRELSLLDWVALVAVVAGGLNCGLIAAVNLDVFATVLPHAAATRGVLALIGLAALRCVVLLFRWAEAPD